jgi:hypothetical protein
MQFAKLPLGNPKDMPCPVCHSMSQGRDYVLKDDESSPAITSQFITCPRCGRFEISDTCSIHASAEDEPLKQKGSRIRADLSAFVRERQRERGEPLFLSRDFLDPAKHDPLGDEFRAQPQLSFTNRADKLLKALASETPGAGHGVNFALASLDWQARAWALDRAEWRALLAYLQEVKRIERDYRGDGVERLWILPSGWQRLEELDKEGPELTQGFVAMCFGEEMERLYDEALAPAIRAAGYAPLRIDQHHGEERIDHRIEVQIKQSRFVVADFTGHRGGVYYEAGYARAQGRPVFFTCHEDHFKDRHFDITQFACLSWTWNSPSLDKLTTDLRFSIENLCGRGPLPPTEDDREAG